MTREVEKRIQFMRNLGYQITPGIEKAIYAERHLAKAELLGEILKLQQEIVIEKGEYFYGILPEDIKSLAEKEGITI